MKLPSFHVYVLYSPRIDKTYLGYTSNIRRRFREHNAIDNSGWTRRGMPWRLVATKRFLDRHSALISERRFKKSRYNKRNWLRSVDRFKLLKDQRNSLSFDFATHSAVRSPA